MASVYERSFSQNKQVTQVKFLQEHFMTHRTHVLNGYSYCFE